MPNIETIEFIYQVVKDRVDNQLNMVDPLDAKAGILIGFIGVILSVSLGLFQESILALFVIGIGLLLVSILIAVIAFRAQLFRQDPEPRPFREIYLDEELESTMITLVDNLVESFEENRDKLVRKSRLVNYSFYIALVGLVFLVLSVVLN